MRTFVPPSAEGDMAGAIRDHAAPA